MSAEKELNLPINPFLIFVLKIEKIIDKSKSIGRAKILPILDKAISMYNNLSYEVVSAKNKARKLIYT